MAEAVRCSECEEFRLARSAAKQADFGGVQIFLPAMRADDIAEQRLVVAALQAVASRRLFIRPTGGEISQFLDHIVDDGAIAHHRSDYLITPALQRRNQLLQLLNR